MKYYRCIEEPKVTEEECNYNMFITYTFNSREKQWRSRNTYYDMYNFDDYYDVYHAPKKYNFYIDKIYKSDDDGVTIIDDGNIVHELDSMKDCFIEIDANLDKNVEELIARKKAKGARITVTPYMLDSRNYKIVYKVECCITSNGSFFARTWGESSDVYGEIINCFKRLRVGGFKGYYHKLKDVLEKQKI